MMFRFFWQGLLALVLTMSFIQCGDDQGDDSGGDGDADGDSDGDSDGDGDADMEDLVGELVWAKKIDNLTFLEAAAGPKGSFALAGENWNTVVLDEGGDNEVVFEERGIVIAMYDREASLQWATQILSNEGLLGFRFGLAVHQDGSVHVTGYFLDDVIFAPGEDEELTFNVPENAYWDMFAAKYDSAGTLAWATRGGVENEEEFEAEGHSITVFENGSSVVVGTFKGGAVFGAGEANETAVTTAPLDGDYMGEVFVARYDKEGQLEWVRTAGDSNPSVLGRPRVNRLSRKPMVRVC